MKKCNFIGTPQVFLRMLYLFFILASTVFAYLILKKNSSDDVREKLSYANSQEREYLTNFFKYSFYSDNLGSVLFFDRPMNMMTVNSCHLPAPVDYMHPLHISNRYKMREAWETWEKYAEFFNSKNYSIVTIKESNPITFFFINHRNFKEMVNQHNEDFHSVLGSDITSEDVLIEFLKGSGPVFNTIINHDGLLGTLLGYGRDNAWEYMRQQGGSKMDSLGYQLPFGSQEIPGMHFKVIIGTKETEFLSKKYDIQRQEINKIYQSDDFLERVLNQLMINPLNEQK